MAMSSHSDTGPQLTPNMGNLNVTSELSVKSAKVTLFCILTRVGDTKKTEPSVISNTK